MKSQKIKCAVGGALAGAANGFFGAGGGTLLVPVFTRLAKIEDKHAYASAVAVMLPLCMASAAVYCVRLTPDFSAAAPYLIGGLVGGFIGGRVFKKVPDKVLRKAFGLLLIFAGIRSLLG